MRGPVAWGKQSRIWNGFSWVSLIATGTRSSPRLSVWECMHTQGTHAFLGPKLPQSWHKKAWEGISLYSFYEKMSRNKFLLFSWEINKLISGTYFRFLNSKCEKKYLASLQISQVVKFRKNYKWTGNWTFSKMHESLHFVLDRQLGPSVPKDELSSVHNAFRCAS